MLNKIKKWSRVDNSGLSMAFWNKEKFLLNNKKIKQMIKYSKSKGQNSRICLHENKNSKTQVMVNLLLKKNNTNDFTSHFQTTEYYLNIYGQLKIEHYLNKKIKKIILKKNGIFVMPKKMLHRAVSDSNYCVFLEIREGRFLKNDTLTSKIL